MRTFESTGNPLYEVVLENLQDKLRVDEELVKLLEKAVIESIKLSDISIGCEVGITLVDDVRIKEINREFRNIDSATDVLSFPIAEMKEGTILSAEGDIDREENLLLLGDIVISLERAEKQAEEYGHSFTREVAFLATHGVFHLLGYDHMSEEQEEKMLEKQEEVLDVLGLAIE
ncbi:MAG: rRNA maturation RNase YbeY [Ruminiclostridium sp.]|nr:rRNA maturation RNase YbeY [Ruminiclostridium sp.]